jgi:hypothetical protein
MMYLILATMVIVVIGVIEMRSSLLRHRRSIQLEPGYPRLGASVVDPERIFVVLPLYQPRDAVSLLDSIFRNAASPRRVSVGIIEHNVPDAPQVADLYYSAQQKGQVLPFSHLIRYRSEPTGTAYGASVARQLVVEELYQGEEFVLFITQQCLLLPSWDRILLSSLRRAQALGGHVISQFPCNATGLPGLMDMPTTFPVFHQFLPRHIPAFRGRFVLSQDRKTFRSGLASFQCLFGSAERLLEDLAVHTPGLPFLRSAAADLLLSGEIWTRGYQVFVPTYSILVRREHTEAPKSWEKVANRTLVKFTQTVIKTLMAGTVPSPIPLYMQKFTRKNQPPFPQFLTWLGLDPAKEHISGQTMMGLLPGHATDEIIHKFGCLRKFRRFKDMLTRDTPMDTL